MITYEQIENANKVLRTTPIKGKDYTEVNQRIKAFRMLFPNGCIETTLLSDDNGICKFKAVVKDDEGRILGTGTAYEKEESSFINKTSYIENCETSAVGRALGMLGIGIDTSVASCEEVQNAMKNQGKDERNIGEAPAPRVKKKIGAVKAKALESLISEKQIDVDFVYSSCHVSNLEELTESQHSYLVKNIDIVAENCKKWKQKQG